MLKYFMPVLVGLGMLAINPVVDAKGGGGGGHGGGHGGGGGRGGGHGSMSGHGGGNIHHGGNFNRGGAFFYGGFYPGLYGSWWGGYGPGYYSYYDYGYAVPSPVYTSPVGPGPQAPPADATAPVPANQTAEIHVLLPRPDAKVWVDGNAMTSGTGTQRSFVSPSLEPGYSYSYRITAAWMDNGQEVRADRTVRVAPGRYSMADFTKASNPQTMPPVQD